MNTDTITKDVITVDHRMSLEGMIGAGKYDWKNDYITPTKFPVQGEGVVEFDTKIFHFDRYISSKEAFAVFEADDRRNPWQPAKIESLLAYGAKNPEEQRNGPIIGLGSVAKVSGNPIVPRLNGRNAARVLDIYWWSGGWIGNYRVLAVRKLSSAA
jgi:hypothetical protein